MFPIQFYKLFRMAVFLYSYDSAEKKYRKKVKNFEKIFQLFHKVLDIFQFFLVRPNILISYRDAVKDSLSISNAFTIIRQCGKKISQKTQKF